MYNDIVKMGGSLLYDEVINAYKKSFPEMKTDELKLKLPEYFVETGTYQASTSIEMSKHFNQVYTMEINKDLYDFSQAKAENLGVKNITFLLGDSLKLLPLISRSIGQKGGVFFIDAHQSGHDSSNNGIRVPLIEEIDIILSNNIGPSLFIVDDLRLWKQKVWDWAHVTNENILEVFTRKGYKILNSFEENDRFFVMI